MKFRGTALKLALIYLAIMMAISIFFSALVYRMSVQELDRGFRPSETFTLLERSLPSAVREQLRDSRQTRLDEARQRVLRSLVLLNLVILAGSGILSYYLAARTLRPIEEAQSALERFTADASHELRTPITAMQSGNEVALMNPKLTLAQAKAQLASNNEELARLTQLTSGLLQLAHLKDGELELSEISSRQLIERAAQGVLAHAEQKQILVITEQIPDSTVRGSETNLTEALVILLENAIKYSPEHSQVTVSARKHAKYLEIRVQDQGIGIDKKDLPHIFDRFYRADSARSSQGTSGYGLGLAIARSIAELHHGTITATSSKGKGSTFTLSLPL